MAESRLHRVGTIFTRMTGLLKSKSLTEMDKPLWYDVYKAFPPSVQPTFDRPVLKTKIREIFYPEDVVRAEFYKKFPHVAMNLSKQNSLVEKFVKKYKEFESDGAEDPFGAATDALSLVPLETRPPAKMTPIIPGTTTEVEDRKIQTVQETS